MDQDNCLDHTYCRSPEDKSALDLLDSSFNEEFSDESSSAICSTEEEMENHSRNENFQSMHLERLRLASDENNAKKNGLCTLEEENLMNGVDLLRKHKSIESNEFNAENLPPSGTVLNPIQISKNPHLSAFVPWKRTKTVASFDNSNTQDESICESDEISLFGDYVASEIRSMKDKYHQTLVKKKIQDAIFEVQMMWLKECNIKMNNCSS